jgi:hypothetical protein
MAQNYDLNVIGTGTAARVAAMRVRKAGKSVAVIDSSPYGGTCALRGCDPKKMLRSGAAVIDDARRMHGKGVAGDAAIDWRELMAFKRTFTDPVPEKQERSYRDAGINTYHGKARFTGSNSLNVDGQELVGRQWSDQAIARTTPVLLGLYSLVSLWACNLLTASSIPYAAAWYRKTNLTFTDAISAARLKIWLGDINQHSPPHREPHYIPAACVIRMAQALCFAA